jgi:hypothetical protein
MNNDFLNFTFIAVVSAVVSVCMVFCEYKILYFAVANSVMPYIFSRTISKNILYNFFPNYLLYFVLFSCISYLNNFVAVLIIGEFGFLAITITSYGKLFSDPALIVGPFFVIVK